MIIEKEIFKPRDRQQIKIWVLDPSDDDSRLIKMVLEKKRGYEVKIFKNASHVIRGLHETPDIDLIITEFELEGKKNGLEFITHVVNTVPDPPPIIMVSNQTSESVAVDCIKFGAMDYIAKDRGWYNHLPLRIVHTLVHKQVVEENRELKTLRDSVFEQMFDSVVVLDTAGHFLLCNENFSSLTGFSTDELLDTSKVSLEKIFRNKQLVTKLLSEISEGLIIKNQKNTIFSKSDETIPVSFSAVYMHYVNKIVFVFTDLRQSETMVKQINELKKYARSVMVISAFKVGEFGPEILSFEDNELFTEEILMKMAIFFSVSLGQGDLIHSGIYGPLPIPMVSPSTNEKYVSLIYSFTIADKDNKDLRAKEKSYCLITINVPEKIVDVFNKRKILNNLFEQALLDFSIKEINEINQEFLLEIKERVLNMQLESTALL